MEDGDGFDINDMYSDPHKVKLTLPERLSVKELKDGHSSKIMSKNTQSGGYHSNKSHSIKNLIRLASARRPKDIEKFRGSNLSIPEIHSNSNISIVNHFYN